MKTFLTLFFLMAFGICYSQVSNVPFYAKTNFVPDTNKTVIFTQSSIIPIVSNVYSTPQLIKTSVVQDVNKNFIFTPSTVTPVVSSVYPTPQSLNANFIVVEPSELKKSLSPINTNKK